MAVIIDIDHETGDLSQYDSTVTDGGDLSVTAAAALAGTNFGLQCLIDDGFSIYGQKNQADPGTKKFRCRFYFDRNTYTAPAGGSNQILRFYCSLNPFNVVAVWIYFRLGGGYEFIFRCYKDEGIEGTIYIIITGIHYIEFYLIQASSDVAADGSCQVWLDGVSQKIWNNVDNYDIFRLMAWVRFGAQGPPFGSGGTFYLDQLKANDDGSEIGPHISGRGGSNSRPVIKIEGAEQFRSIRRHSLW